jgi:hypothetical protein
MYRARQSRKFDHILCQLSPLVNSLYLTSILILSSQLISSIRVFHLKERIVQ